jgi:hypothetical protein
VIGKAVYDAGRLNNLNQLTIRYVCIASNEDYFKYLIDNQINMTISARGYRMNATAGPDTVFMKCGINNAIKILDAVWGLGNNLACYSDVTNIINDECIKQSLKYKTDVNAAEKGCLLWPDHQWLRPIKPINCTIADINGYVAKVNFQCTKKSQ